MADITTISRGTASASVDAHGAQLRSLKLGDVEYLWQADERWWPRSAPVLFPIVGKIRNGFATCSAGECHLSRHGIARNYDHELVKNTGSSLTYRFESTAETREAYPYDFRLEMTYALEGDATLAQTFAVTNTGSVDLPFCLGGHPAFNVPVRKGEAFEDYTLWFSRAWTGTSPTGEDGIENYGRMRTMVDGTNRLPLTHELFAADSFTLEGVPDSTISMVGPTGHGVRVDFEGFDHIGVWSAGPAADGTPAPFVALEPWCGTATRTDEDDVLEHKQNVIVAAPGQTVRRAFHITML